MNEGKAAVLYGPLVLAADEGLLGNTNLSLNGVSLAGATVSALAVTPEPAPDAVKSWPGARVFRVNAVARRSTGRLTAGTPLLIRLIPFADAGEAGTSYKVWLPLVPGLPGGNVLLDGQEGRSRTGNAMGSIKDEDLRGFVVTFDHPSQPQTRPLTRPADLGINP